MPKQSAGILLYKTTATVLMIFLVHPGGPFYKNKDEGAWSIPKGEFLDDEDTLAAAKREFFEETGYAVEGKFIKLTPVKLKSGKLIHAWAIKGDIDPAGINSSLFTLEWPPKSGKFQEFPEVDRGGWFDPDMAKVKINVGQVGLIDELCRLEHDSKD